ncbi:ribonuclease H-like domain-containing protein [Tanacetum coccineum]
MITTPESCLYYTTTIREVPSLDEPKPQPQPLPSCPSFDVSLGNQRGHEPPIKPHSLNSFRRKEIDSLTIYTPHLPHVASFLPKDTYCYYHPCINDPKKHYGFKPGRGLNSPVRPKEVEKVMIKETHQSEHKIQQILFQHMAPSRHHDMEEWRLDNYIQMIDYALWEVIENGATLPKTKIMEGVMTEMPITTAEEKAQRRLEVKARSTLMMGIPNEHQLKFNSIKDAKKLLEAVEKRFGGNAATRKTQRNLLKQQYENFTAPSSEMLDQTFDRLQKLVSQLELLDEKLSQEDVNQKLLRSLSPEWNTHAVVWRNKADLDTMSMDDLYNNLECRTGLNTNEAVNTAYGVSTSTQVNDVNFTNIDNFSDAVIYDMEEMDLRWQMAMLTMRARRFLKNTGRKLTVNGNETIGFDKSKVECYNCHKRGHFARECRAPRNQDNKNKESSRRSVPVEISTSTTLVSCDGLGGYDWSLESVEEKLEVYKANESIYLQDIKGLKFEIHIGEITIRELRKKLEIVQKEKDGIQLNVDKFEHASKSLNKLIECQIVDNYKKGLGYENYNAVPPPYTGNFMPPTPDLSFTGLDEFVNKPVVENCKAMSSKEEPKGNPQIDLQDKGVIDSGCSRHMTGNMSYLTDYEEIDGGYVAFGGNPKGGKITGKGTIKTGNLDFENVFSESTPNVVGTKSSDNAGQARKETKPIKDYILLPLWTVDRPYFQDPKSSHDDGSKPSSDEGKKVD